MTSAAPEDHLEALVGNKVVTVSTLRVDGKKMTLQFFKQIPRDKWLDDDLTPRPNMTVWGRVHYRIPDEGIEWLLVQVDGQMKRCNIDRSSPFKYFLESAQRKLESASQAVRRHELDVAETQRKIDSAGNAELKKVFEDSLAKQNAWLQKARADVAASQTEIQQELERHERSRREAARLDGLANVPQLYIGS